MTSSQAAIAAAGLRKSYGDTLALDGIDLIETLRGLLTGTPDRQRRGRRAGVVRRPHPGRLPLGTGHVTTGNLAAAATLPPDHPIRRRLLLWAVALGLVGVLGRAGLAAWFPALAEGRQPASPPPPSSALTDGRNP